MLVNLVFKQIGNFFIVNLVLICKLQNFVESSQGILGSFTETSPSQPRFKFQIKISKKNYFNFLIFVQKRLSDGLIWLSRKHLLDLKHELKVMSLNPHSGYCWTLFWCRICIGCLKRPKINEKEGENDEPFF